MNRSQADINKNTDMMYARRREQEYFATSPDYGHLASKMGSEYLAKLLSRVCSVVCAQYFPVFINLSFTCDTKKFTMFACFHLQHLESVIKAKIPGIISLINKGIDEMEAELDRLGRPIAVDAGVSSFGYVYAMSFYIR